MSQDKAAREPTDLALAAQLQLALLPRQVPAMLAHHVIAARNRMCGSVGGDFYDFLMLNDEQVALVIGDVIGHGVSASLIMAQIMGYLRSQGAARSRPREVIRGLNQMLLELGERSGSVTPCSMFYAVLDEPTGVCFFVNAGHPRPLLLDRNHRSLHHLGSHDLLLGVEATEFQEMCHTFVAGQRMILYTDGVTDAMNPSGEFYELVRLRQLAARQMDDGAEAVADAMFKDVSAFRSGAGQCDDETIVVVDRT